MVVYIPLLLVITCTDSTTNVPRILQSTDYQIEVRIFFIIKYILFQSP